MSKNPDKRNKRNVDVKQVPTMMSASHPVSIFKSENREAENLVASIREAVTKRREYELASTKERLKSLLQQLKAIEAHYARKEQLLLPYLERRGLTQSLGMMREKDRKIRDRINAALTDLENITSQKALREYTKQTLNPLFKQISEIVLEEESELLPASLEKLDLDDWFEIREASDGIGYAFIDKSREREARLHEMRRSLLEEPLLEENTIFLPTGAFLPEELMFFLNTLPVDVTFVDKEDKVRYFSEGKDRVFGRQRAVIGQTVQNCHQAESIHVVEKILASFKDGSRDSYDFWMDYHGRFLYIRYFAVRDKNRQYLGTLEVMQDISQIKKLKGQHTLIDEER